MPEILRYIIAILFLLLLLFEIIRRGRKKSNTERFSIADKIIVIGIVICIILTFYLIIKAQQLNK